MNSTTERTSATEWAMLAIILLCLAVTGVSSFIVKQNVLEYNGLFASMEAEANRRTQISIAQQHSLRTLAFAEDASVRASRLECELWDTRDALQAVGRQAESLQVQVMMDMMTMKSQATYIKQLIEYIDGQGLSAPPLDLNRIFDDPEQCEGGQCIIPSEEGVDPDAPSIIIELFDMDGNLIHTQLLAPDEIDAEDSGP